MNIDSWYNKIEEHRLTNRLYGVSLVLGFAAGLCIYHGYYKLFFILFVLNALYALHIDFKIKDLKIHMD